MITEAKSRSRVRKGFQGRGLRAQFETTNEEWPRENRRKGAGGEKQQLGLGNSLTSGKGPVTLTHSCHPGVSFLTDAKVHRACVVMTTHRE